MKQKIYESLAFDQHKLKTKIKELEACGKVLGQYGDLQCEFDKLDQYGCLLIHGIPEPLQSTIEDTCPSNPDNKRQASTTLKSDLDQSRRLGRRIAPSVSSKPRPIIAKFTSYKIRFEVFRVKRKLKGLGLGISESLTVRRQILFNTVKQNPKVEKTLTLPKITRK